MRLFMAINFENNVKDAVQNIIDDLKKYSKQGKYVDSEHMHLTLEFLGDISPDKVDLIIDAMNQISGEKFILALSKIGYFKRREGNIYWIGFTESPSLFRIQSKLHSILVDRGFDLENREYKPHLTIGRKILMNSNFNPERYLEDLGEIKISVEKIDLMQSEYIDGKLKYKVIYSRDIRD